MTASGSCGSSLCRLYLATALTPVHVGVGRSPGVVDLPLARDGFGLPYLPGSSLKGSVKNLCMRVFNGDRCSRAYGWDVRLAGSISPEDVYASPLVFTDGFLLAYPARYEAKTGGSWETGFAMVTSRLQLARLANIGGTCEPGSGLIEEARRLLEPGDAGGGTGGGSGDRLLFNGVPVDPSTVRSGDRLAQAIRDTLSGDYLVDLLLGSGLYIVDDSVFRDIVEAGIIRQARVRLNPRTKTVETGGLWTEEYSSQGAIYFFAVIARSVGHHRADPPQEALQLNHRLLCSQANCSLVIGGKETIGKGLLRLHHTQAS